MKDIQQIKRTLLWLALLGAAALLTGCHELNVKTTIQADGSGVREMELLAEVEKEGEEPFLTLSDYRQLMNATSERGWSHKQVRRKSKNSEELRDYHSFTRREQAASIFELARMSGDIRIIGTNHDSRFNGVYFTNAIDVETGINTRGRTLDYRETFTWTGMIEALLDYRLESYRPKLQQAYPGLQSAEVDEWFGFFKGSFLAAVDDGIFALESGDRLRRFGKSIDRLVAYGMDMIRRDDADADGALVTEAARDIFVAWDEFDKTAEEMDLMGVVLAVGLDFTLRIDIPGRIVETNADRKETYSDPDAGRQVLVWEIDPAEAVSRPIEVFVKSEVPNP